MFNTWKGIIDQFKTIYTGIKQAFKFNTDCKVNEDAMKNKTVKMTKNNIKTNLEQKTLI